jgi:MFS family permease
MSSVGIIILMTIMAFEAMAVATAMPSAARALNGLSSYGLTFTGFLAASTIGMVGSGLYSDRHGPAVPLFAGLALFMAGLLAGSAATAMFQLVAARVTQGLSVGLLITAMYVVIGEGYPDEVRPKIFAALAGAWVVPGLVGPVVAGWVTEHLSWRWVFGGLTPFVAVGGLLLIPASRRLRTHPSHSERTEFGRLGYAVLAAVGIAAIAQAGQNRSWFAAISAAVGLAALIAGLLRLVPAGTFTFSHGAPAAIAYRGILAGTFFGMESVVPLTLSVQWHYSPTASGVPLMLTALSWAAGSWVQGRRPDVDRVLLVRAGLLLMSVAGVIMALVALRVVAGWAAYLGWPVAGLGAGFALTSVSVVLLECSDDADRGSNSAALQLSDSSMSAVCTAFAGTLVALAAHGRIGYGRGLSVVFLVLAVLPLVAAKRAARLRPTPARHGG